MAVEIELVGEIKNILGHVLAREGEVNLLVDSFDFLEADRILNRLFEVAALLTVQGGLLRFGIRRHRLFRDLFRHSLELQVANAVLLQL